MSLTIIKKTEISKLETFNKWKQNPGKGEVFTPKELVNEMLDQIPTKIWEDPKSTFCDQSMGKGTFLIEIVNRLVYIYGHKEEDAKSRVFGYEIRVKYVNYLKRRGYKNVFHKDSLTEKFNMEFDVVLGNPPYQKKVGPKKTEAIWPKFVEKSFEICKEGGYVSLIHPNGWRNVDGNYKKTQQLLKSKNFINLKMYSDLDGLKIFNAAINFDTYLIQNIEKNNQKTEIQTQDKKIIYANIENMRFIPNGSFDNIFSLVAKKEEETVNVLYSRSDYGTDKKHMSNFLSEENIYPCISNVTKSENIKILYSKINTNGHFGVPKLVCGGASSGTNYFIDNNGEYGITQFSFGIVDSPENLINIKKALKSNKFQKLIKDIPNNSSALNHKILATFRKDFWRDFLDENNDVIEPNYNNAE